MKVHLGKRFLIWGGRSPGHYKMKGNMSAEVRQSDLRNLLLQGLSESEFALFAPLLTPVDLQMRQHLETAGRRIRHVYFPDDGLASVVAVSRPTGRPAEVGLIGRDGMTGIALVHGVDRSPFDIFVQAPGKAWAIEAAALSSLLAANRSIFWRFLRYGHLFYLQVGGAVLANAIGSTEERLSRWLLMTHDRLGVEELHITHELFSIMLGVRRPGVTVSLRRLEAEGLIEVRRGMTVVRDREGLLRRSNGLYGAPEAEQERLFGPWRPAADHEPQVSAHDG